MFDFVLGMIVCLPFAFLFGYWVNKYRNEKSELFENINLIREDVTNLQIQFSAFINK